MRGTEITKNFGESFVASLFLNMDFEVDIADAQGIDLACYKKDKSGGYGVSVKTRNIELRPNDSINITYNDIVYTYEQSKDVRGLEPAYALVVMDLKKIDVLIVTQDYAFKNLFNDSDITNIDEYKQKFKGKDDSGATKSISISLKAKNLWKEWKDDSGVIFTASFVRE